MNTLASLTSPHFDSKGQKPSSIQSCPLSHRLARQSGRDMRQTRAALTLRSPASSRQPATTSDPVSSYRAISSRLSPLMATFSWGMASLYRFPRVCKPGRG